MTISTSGNAGLSMERLRELAVVALTTNHITAEMAEHQVTVATAVHHGGNRLRSWFMETTNNLRHEMTMRGELEGGTCIWVAPIGKTREVSAANVAWFKRCA